MAALGLAGTGCKKAPEKAASTATSVAPASAAATPPAAEPAPASAPATASAPAPAGPAAADPATPTPMAAPSDPAAPAAAAPVPTPDAASPGVTQGEIVARLQGRRVFGQPGFRLMELQVDGTKVTKTTFAEAKGQPDDTITGELSVVGPRIIAILDATGAEQDKLTWWEEDGQIKVANTVFPVSPFTGAKDFDLSLGDGDVVRFVDGRCQLVKGDDPSKPTDIACSYSAQDGTFTHTGADGTETSYFKSGASWVPYIHKMGVCLTALSRAESAAVEAKLAGNFAIVGPSEYRLEVEFDHGWGKVTVPVQDEPPTITEGRIVVTSPWSVAIVPNTNAMLLKRIAIWREGDQLYLSPDGAAPTRVADRTAFAFNTECEIPGCGTVEVSGEACKITGGVGAPPPVSCTFVKEGDAEHFDVAVRDTPPVAFPVVGDMILGSQLRKYRAYPKGQEPPSGAPTGEAAPAPAAEAAPAPAGEPAPAPAGEPAPAPAGEPAPAPAAEPAPAPAP